MISIACLFCHSNNDKSFFSQAGSGGPFPDCFADVIGSEYKVYTDPAITSDLTAWSMSMCYDNILLRSFGKLPSYSQQF